jgi:hypothetical protein
MPSRIGLFRNDPWSHPVSSRHGGGSGNVVPANQTYESLGGAFLPTREHLLSLYRKPIPTAHTDHWRIFISRGRWNNDKIRKAIWRCALTGGQAPFPDYSQGPFDEEQFLTGNKQIAIAMDFIQKGLRYGLGDLEPDDSIVRNTSGIIAAINRGKEVVVFNEANAEILVNLSSFDSAVLYNWLDTKNGRINQNFYVCFVKHDYFLSPVDSSNNSRGIPNNGIIWFKIPKSIPQSLLYKIHGNSNLLIACKKLFFIERSLRIVWKGGLSAGKCAAPNGFPDLVVVPSTSGNKDSPVIRVRGGDRFTVQGQKVLPRRKEGSSKTFVGLICWNHVATTPPVPAADRMTPRIVSE